MNSIESNRLLGSIAKTKCIPFIGPETYSLATKDDISSNILEKYTYPIKRGDPLNKITQYISVKNNDLDAKNIVADYLLKIKIPDFRLEENNDSPYTILSSLDLPIFITTNYDHFMEEALICRGKEPVSDFCRWNDNLSTFAKNAELPDIFDSSSNYIPKINQPLVYHLHGDMNTPQSMVLTEKDYFDFLINIHQLRDEALPSVIIKGLTTSRLLFLGYNIEDIIFRAIFHGIISLFNTLSEKGLAVSLQLKKQSVKQKEQADYLNYLRDYATKLYNIQTIEEDLDSFLKALRISIDQYKKAKQANTGVVSV